MRIKKLIVIDPYPIFFLFLEIIYTFLLPEPTFLSLLYSKLLLPFSYRNFGRVACREHCIEIGKPCLGIHLFLMSCFFFSLFRRRNLKEIILSSMLLFLLSFSVNYIRLVLILFEKSFHEVFLILTPIIAYAEAILINKFLFE